MQRQGVPLPVGSSSNQRWTDYPFAVTIRRRSALMRMATYDLLYQWLTGPVHILRP
jgi:hypothetical protein